MKSATIFTFAVVISTLAFGSAAASNLTYLSCDVPEDNGAPDRHFDFTLNEAEGTVSFYVKEANATNVEKAMFGPDTITWTTTSEFFSITRIISRVDLSFKEKSTLLGSTFTHVGSCELKKPRKRQF